MLRAQGLTLWRGTNCLFEELSFTAADGTALLLRGPNGAGKTTLLRVLCGLTRPETGQVAWRGHDIDADREPFHADLAYCGHATGLKADLTVTQNLRFAARLRGQPDCAWSDVLRELMLLPCADLEVRYLSAGQKRRTALARLLTSGAALWLVDEPFTNLDRAGSAYLRERMITHLRSGGTLVAATHQELELDDIEVQTIELGDAA